MSETEQWYGIEDVPSVADIAWLNQHEEGHRESSALPVRIVDFPRFITTEEQSSEPLLGTQNDTILPLDGTLLMYGDGGAGKTTLTIDAVSHLGSGEPWLGIPVERPVKTLLIENEGPRGKFRQRLAEKDASWNGHPPFSPNVHVLEDPWTRFTLRDASHREAVAAAVTGLDVDLVVMGPLVTLGMVGGGTPDEVAEFEELMRILRALVTRPFSFWIIHHENKAGDVSGAWERVPDALCHVQSQGNGHTRVVFQKARWSDSYHGTKLDLIWADGRTFRVKEDLARDLHAEILEAFLASDQWRTLKEIGKLIEARQTDVKAALSDLVERAEMVMQKGPPGRHQNAVCWRIECAPELWEHTGAHVLAEATGRVSPGFPPPRRGGIPGAHDLPEDAGVLPPSGAHGLDPLREPPPF